MACATGREFHVARRWRAACARATHTPCEGAWRGRAPQARASTGPKRGIRPSSAQGSTGRWDRRAYEHSHGARTARQRQGHDVALRCLAARRRARPSGRARALRRRHPPASPWKPWQRRRWALGALRASCQRPRCAKAGAARAPALRQEAAQRRSTTAQRRRIRPWSGCWCESTRIRRYKTHHARLLRRLRGAFTLQQAAQPAPAARAWLHGRLQHQRTALPHAGDAACYCVEAPSVYVSREKETRLQTTPRRRTTCQVVRAGVDVRRRLRLARGADVDQQSPRPSPASSRAAAPRRRTYRARDCHRVGQQEHGGRVRRRHDAV